MKEEFMNKFLDTVCGAAEEIGSSFTQPDDDWAAMMQTATPHEDAFRVYTFGFDERLLASDEAKDFLSENMMVPIITGTGAKLVATVFSSWQIRFEGDEAMKQLANGQYTGPRPSQSPQRIEAVMVTAIAPTKIVVRCAEIHRDNVHPPTLDAWDQWDEEGNGIFTGRFTTPLQAALRDSSGKVNEKWIKLVFGEG